MKRMSVLSVDCNEHSKCQCTMTGCYTICFRRLITLTLRCFNAVFNLNLTKKYLQIHFFIIKITNQSPFNYQLIHFYPINLNINQIQIQFQIIVSKKHSYF